MHFTFDTGGTMRAEIVSTGTELLLGQIDDTNATYLARQLRDLGIDLFFRTTVGDNELRIAQALDLALSRADVAIPSCWPRSRRFLAVSART
jgi:nicotinamide-nucleotide amidase